MKKIDPKKYSKSQSNKAGIILRENNISKEEREKALEVLSNWRASHNYPMQVFYNRLKRVSEKIDSNSLTAQRLKRVPSILAKLNRKYDGMDKPSMKLTQMQDIAGCRVVLSTVKLVNYLFEEEYIKGDLKHKRIKINNYIKNPKHDGYRSIHLIYEYFSDKGRTEFNNFLVEIQIRSKLQHIWATAVETVGFFTKQAIKSNEGEEAWLEFFKLISSAFAKLENCPSIEGTPDDEKELYQLIKEKEKKLDVKHRMINWAESIQFVENNLKDKKNIYFYLLQLDINLDTISIKAYTKKQEQKAVADYLDVEKKVYDQKGYDVVLVGAETLQDLKKAYPNYFLDTKEFLKYLDKVLNKCT